MDNLAKDAFMARQKGMTYGKYMATKKPADRNVPTRKAQVNSGDVNCYCAKCGKAFVKKNQLRRKYCSLECRNSVKAERALERYRRLKSKKAADE